MITDNSQNVEKFSTKSCSLLKNFINLARI